MTTIINSYGYAVNFAAAVELMDDDIREAINNETIIDDEQQYFNEYCRRHAAEYGEPFALDIPSPQY